LTVGNDAVIRGAKLHAGKSYVECVIEQLYSLKLLCERHIPASQVGLSPEAAPFCVRQDAAVAAHLRS